MNYVIARPACFASACPVLATSKCWPRRCPSFSRSTPDIRLDVSIDDAFVDIVESGFDAGMRIGEMVQRDMMGVRLTPDFRTAIVGSPGYFAGRKKPKHPRDLGEHDCINYKRRAQGGLYRWEFTDEGRELEIAVSGRLVLDDGNLMVRAAVDGLGLAYVMESAVRTELAEKRLVRVLESYCEPYPGLFLYYPSRLHVAPKLQALIGHLRRRKHGR